MSVLTQSSAFFKFTVINLNFILSNYQNSLTHNYIVTLQITVFFNC